MTFVKDPLNATTPREIIEYSQDLEDRVEVGFEDLENRVDDFAENSYTKSEVNELVKWKRIDTLTSAFQITSTAIATPNYVSTSEALSPNSVYAIVLGTSVDNRNDNISIFTGGNGSAGTLGLFNFTSAVTVNRVVNSNGLGLYSASQTLYVKALYKVF